MTSTPVAPASVRAARSSAPYAPANFEAPVAFDQLVDVAAPTAQIALGHDYLTQRGGAERVAEMMLRAYPGSPLYTTLYDPEQTFPEFAGHDIRTSGLDKISVLRRHHRLAYPLLARATSAMTVDADALLVSSSGWAHGMQTSGKKIVYCHAPARWLYQTERYLGPRDGLDVKQKLRRAAGAAMITTGRSRQLRWDQQQAAAADRYVVNSTVVAIAVERAYGITAEVLPPPPAMLPGGAVIPVPGIARPFVLCVARLLPYKNVGPVIEAVRALGDVDLVVVGEGPDRARLTGIAAGDPRVHLVGKLSDEELRWCYANCEALVAASFEDYGLSPLEAASFGKPTTALHDGGFLDTIDSAVNGVFFGGPDAGMIADALQTCLRQTWQADRIRAHAQKFSAARFTARLRAIVDEVLAG
ncbi:MAG: glycosyltransferase [Propionibacteriaceae bacterium]